MTQEEYKALKPGDIIISSSGFKYRVEDDIPVMKISQIKYYVDSFELFKEDECPLTPKA